MNQNANQHARSTLAPWLPVRGGARVVAFYREAFGAEETYHLDGPDGGFVARLAVGGSEFWVADDGTAAESAPVPDNSGVRFILTVPDPDAVFARAIAAGARQIYPMMEEHGWRVGRVVDPFGYHWEIGIELAEG